MQIYKDLIVVIGNILFSNLFLKILIHYKVGLLSLNLFDTKASVNGWVAKGN